MASRGVEASFTSHLAGHEPYEIGLPHLRLSTSGTWNRCLQAPGTGYERASQGARLWMPERPRGLMLLGACASVLAAVEATSLLAEAVLQGFSSAQTMLQVEVVGVERSLSHKRDPCSMLLGTWRFSTSGSETRAALRFEGDSARRMPFRITLRASSLENALFARSWTLTVRNKMQVGKHPGEPTLSFHFAFWPRLHGVAHMTFEAIVTRRCSNEEAQVLLRGKVSDQTTALHVHRFKRLPLNEDVAWPHVSRT